MLISIYNPIGCDPRHTQGNGHRLVSGAGTPTLTFTASGLFSPGTVYFGFHENLVVSVDGGLPNSAVRCVVVPEGERGVPGEGPPIPSDKPVVPSDKPAVPADGPGPPILLSALADPVHNKAHLTFNRYADEGDPAQFFVYRDSTCSTPAGRGTRVWPETQDHQFFSVSVSGFVVGTNWIRIEPGFVTGPGGGLPNEASPCTPVEGRDVPKFVSAKIDLAKSTLSITYDRPIRLADWTVVFTAAPGTESLTRATRYVGTEGNNTIVLEMPNLQPGTNLVKINSGFVADTWIRSLEESPFQLEAQTA